MSLPRGRLGLTTGAAGSEEQVMARPSGRDVRTEVLDAAQSAIQTDGVGGFSYHDLARRLGVRAPSIHHHFRHKTDLVADVSARYRSEFRRRATAIDAPTAALRLTAYAALFAETAQEGLMCLCGAVAADWSAASDEVREEVTGFFADEVDWVELQISIGVDTGEFRAGIDPRAMAQAVVSMLEGTLLLVRAGAGPVTLAVESVRTLVHLAAA